MSQSRLRVYYGPEEVATQVARSTIPLRQEVTLPLGEVLPLLIEAVESRRQWVGDFRDDEITISSDLYEVLLEFRSSRPTSA